jgi:hypothetical protein
LLTTPALSVPVLVPPQMAFVCEQAVIESAGGADMVCEQVTELQLSVTVKV